MAAIANILATTLTGLSPVGVEIFTSSNTIAADKTFAPAGPVGPGVNRWVDRSGGQAVNFPSYTFSVRQPVGNYRNYRIKETIVLPVANVTSPSTGSGIQPLPSKAYELTCHRDWIIPEAAVAADRQIFWSLCASFQADRIIAADGAPESLVAGPLRSSILDLDQPY